MFPFAIEWLFFGFTLGGMLVGGGAVIVIQSLNDE